MKARLLQIIAALAMLYAGTAAEEKPFAAVASALEEVIVEKIKFYEDDGPFSVRVPHVRDMLSPYKAMPESLEVGLNARLKDRWHSYIPLDKVKYPDPAIDRNNPDFHGAVDVKGRPVKVLTITGIQYDSPDSIVIGWRYGIGGMGGVGGADSVTKKDGKWVVSIVGSPYDYD